MKVIIFQSLALILVNQATLNISIIHIEKVKGYQRRAEIMITSQLLMAVEKSKSAKVL
jgi:hypothetical protein